MAEENLLKREDHCRLGPEDNPETQSQQFLLSQTCKERLYQQRQKCELRRLLKHTHPELKMLDEVVDEELAEVLSSETEVTADETGYEGEVRSRRLIFENCSQSDKVSVYTPRMHMTEEIVEKGNISKTSAVFEHPDKRPSVDQTVASSPKPTKECEEDVIRIDVQATRKIFESPCVDTPQSSPDNVQGKVVTPGALTGLVQKQGREKCDHQNLQHQEKSSNVNWTEQPKQRLCDFNHSTVKVDDESSSLEVKEEHKDSIKTRASLMQNNPFISKNIEHFYAHMANPKITADDDCAAKVKNKAHLFESMPFDKIRHQNKDEVETMVETLKESLSSLHHFNVIHADGSIIEVNETMRAKKAKYALSESGAEITYNEVSEGNFQNLILRVLPRANLKPQVTYLTEACSGVIKRTLVNVPVHPHQFTGRQDTECNTANVVQLVEDILNQDNSLRKGAIIQEASDKSADIIVYSLHKYLDEEDVRRYCPREYLARTNERISPLISPDSICQESVSPEVTMKRFKSCIEKGDLEDLKTLQAKSVVEEQEVPLKQMMGQCTDTDPEQRGDLADEGTPEWAPVDIKRLRNIFSGDQIQSQSNKIANKDLSSSTTMLKSFTRQNVTLDNIHPSPVNYCDVPTERRARDKMVACDSQAHEESKDSLSLVQSENQCRDRVVQAESIEVVDDNNDEEISKIQNAIHCLQEATMEARLLHHLSQEKQKNKSIQSIERPIISAQDINSQVIHQEPNTSPRNSGKSEEMCLRINSVPDIKHETECLNQIVSEEIHTATSNKNINSTEEVPVQHFQAAVLSPDSSEKQHGEEEIVFQGKLKSALDSLARSNINVTRGDFKAAMIYRNSSKPSKEIVKNVAVFPDKAINQDVCAMASQTQVCPNKVIEAGTSTANAKSISTAPQKSRRPVGPKPTIPPKPDHLKIKLQKNHSNNTENSLKLLIDKNYTDTAKRTEIMSKINTGLESEHDVVSHRRLGEGLQNPQDFPKEQLHGSLIPMGKNDKDNLQGEIKEPAQRKVSQDILIKEKMTETEEAHLDFKEACKKFGSTNDLPKNRPLIKPKRVKIAQCDNQMSPIPAQVGAEPQPPLFCAVIQGNKKDAKDEQEIKQEGKFELRAKKGRTETEDERRQRLSVHMDEILRGNTEAAMEIFDNLRKQEELRGILSRVEEIGEDTSKVDVRSLRKVFENVPDWVVPSNKKKLKQAKAEHKEETKTPLATASKSSMAQVFGDLERASEEIMTLKEQTLARLVDIEEAIKKALYSVSALKSESDITGLSCLFKESLGSVQRSPASGNISRISIGSGKMASLQIKEDPTAPPGGQNASAERTPKFREGPQCTPAFISIQSASDKPELLPKETTICPTCQHSPEKFRSAKLLQCNGPALNREEPADCFPQREISVLEVQTDLEGSRILGTKTVTENYERTDTHGNRIYSSTTTVVTTQPETKTSTTDLKPALHQLATYPEVLLPVNQNP
ncbi:LIM domain-containing protein isoform X2 [Phyllopteryx taeniolatus]|nr:LIM domain-containing protein isoform X2 [Phyllopteryx taeniolatus]XP_061613912.1 LIM domain-containing protein isoform X2 [Phyllopteryx taeniolatus]